MCKNLFVALAAGIFILVSVTGSFAAMDSMEHAQKAQSGSVSKAVNVGNTICPVSGEKINEASKATYEYKGKIYNFCCPMCIGEFKKDPEEYIKKIKD
jgi:YHS domain-containing protein